MKSYTDSWSPKIAILIWRIFTLLILFVLWFMGNVETEGFTLVFVLVTLSLARWRFSLPAWTTLVDQILCMTIIPFWPEARFGLVLPLFETMLAGKPLFSLPILAAVVIGYVHHDFPLFLCSFKLHLQDGSFYVGRSRYITIDWRQIRSGASAMSWKC